MWPQNKNPKEFLTETEDIKSYLQDQLRLSRWQKAKMRFPVLRFSRLWAILAPFVIFGSIYLFVLVFTAPPGYSEKETALAEKQIVVTGSPQFLENHRKTMEFLKKHYPSYYKKIINSPEKIAGSLKIGVFVIAGLSTRARAYMAKLSDGTLIKKEIQVNQNPYDQPFQSDGALYEYAEVLVHEADHIEYAQASWFRNVLLAIRCSPLINWDIALFETAIIDVEHKVRPVEICAIRQQLAFRKKVQKDQYPAGISKNINTN